MYRSVLALIVICVLALQAALSCSGAVLPASSGPSAGAQPGATSAAPPPPPFALTPAAVLPGGPQYYTYRIVHVYPHDADAFTQGLVFDGEALYEGTGLNGRSSLRRVDLQTGRVLQRIDLAQQYFGEGIAVYGERIAQLTYQTHVGFVYDKTSLRLLREFSYPTEGWGLTFDGRRLIMSDGTATLRFLDPETLEETGRVEVSDGATPVLRLNELEYVGGEILANVWLTDRIARISPATGRVSGWIDLRGLLGPEEARQVDVLNGIAYDAVRDRLFVTGKLWPKLFEIELLPASR